jgi:hypothetical protein
MSVAGGGASGSGQDDLPDRAKVFTVASWVMLPMLIVSFGVGYAIGVMLMGALGVHEGQVLAHAGALGWLAAALVLLIGVAPVAAGVYLGRRAMREGAGGPAKAALIVNGIVLTYLVVVQVLQQAGG